jgi:hypothetical protein
MTGTLTDRIKLKQRTEPTPIPLRISPFTKAALEKRLPPKGTFGVWLHDGCGPDGAAA